MVERKAMIQRRISTLPMPIQRCPSHIGVDVHGNADLLCAARLSPSRGVAWSYTTASRFADAELVLRAVAGSDPPVRHASYGTASVGMCTAIPPPPRVAPGPAIPCGKAIEPVFRDWVRPCGQVRRHAGRG